MALLAEFGPTGDKGKIDFAGMYERGRAQLRRLQGGHGAPVYAKEKDERVI